METANIDRGGLAEDNTVRVDEIDITAACDRTIDGRGIAPCNQIQIVFAVIGNGLPIFHGVTIPFDEVVCCGAANIGRTAYAADSNT